MGTPADRVHSSLLHHLHLVVRTPLPRQPVPDLNAVVNILSKAPELTQHQATVEWRFLSQPPADGESMLVWQPPQLGTAFASDGYVWADAETFMVHEHNGETLEIFLHRSGFRPQQEQMATHSRRRYRLKHDPSLWLVCYHQADQRDFRPARSVQLDNNTRRLLSERAHLERNKTQLVRQEFMLHDTAKYPTVSIPGPPVGQVTHPQPNMAYPGNVMAQMNRSQYNAHLQQQQRAMAAQAAQAGFGPSPSKRPRHGSNMPPGMSTTRIPMSHAKPKPVEAMGDVIDEMDGTVPDAMDVLTPRDIALSRYTQHHEWLEEILSSPFDTHRIIPSELGIGRKGELESLTRDFFDAPVYQKVVGKKLPDAEYVTRDMVESNKPAVQDEPIARVGRLEGEKAEEFSTKASEAVAAINQEMEVMKKQHAERMARLSRANAFREAEEKVRIATLELINGDVEESFPTQDQEIDDLQKALEKNEGGSLVSIAAVECTDKGGQEESRKETVEAPREPEDFDMTGTDTFDLDGAQFPTPPEPAASNDAAVEPTAMNNNALPPSDIQGDAEQPSIVQPGEMQTTQEQAEAEDAPTPAEDFVMVSKDDASPADAEEEPAHTTEPDDYPEPVDQNTAEELPDFGDSQQEDNFETNDFGGDGIDFGDLDTAGDELSGYTQEITNMSAEAGDQSDDLDLSTPPTKSIVPEDAAVPEAPGHPAE